MLAHIWHFFLHWTGSDNVSGPQYGFWSGFGSDITEFALLGLAFKAFRHLNCKVKGCPRIGKQAVQGTPYKTCHRHATPDIHKALHKQHKWQYPNQHKLLNK